MVKIAKLYRDNVIHCLIHKYSMEEIEATKLAKSSYLNEALEKNYEITMHDDIEYIAMLLYESYVRCE